MSSTTINISLPKSLKQAVDDQVDLGMYTSISEFIRSAIRKFINYNEPFSSETERKILKISKLTQKNRDQNLTLKSNKDIDAFFKAL